MEKSWRYTILSTLHQESELHVDAFHEGASSDGEAEIEAMYAEVEKLEAEGLIHDDHGLLTLTEAGKIAPYEDT